MDTDLGDAVTKEQKHSVVCRSLRDPWRGRRDYLLPESVRVSRSRVVWSIPPARRRVPAGSDSRSQSGPRPVTNMTV
jgi:hypothetical protein